MKKFVFLFLLFSFSLFGQEGQVYLLGHPGSGNHWTVYCLSKLLEIPCISHPYTAPFLFESPDWRGKVNCSEHETFSCFYHGHNPIDATLHLGDRSQDLLVVVLRDFKESYMSNDYDREENVINHLKDEIAHGERIEDPFLERCNSLINTLRCFDAWPEDRRLLIYYEDLLLYPEQVLLEIAQFFNFENLNLVDEFLVNYRSHQERCFHLSNFDAERQNYFDFKRHSRKMSAEGRLLLDELLQSAWPDLWGKYLSRYQEGLIYSQ